MTDDNRKSAKANKLRHSQNGLAQQRPQVLQQSMVNQITPDGLVNYDGSTVLNTSMNFFKGNSTQKVSVGKSG